MIDARRQFRVLYRDFLVRLVDLELLSADGDLQKLFVPIGAILGGFSFVLSLHLVPQYAFSKLSQTSRALAASGDQEFLLAVTMVVVGMFAILSWNVVLPDKRESLILGALPIRPRTIFQAKIAAIATGLAISIVAVNAFTGLTYPFLVMPADGGILAPLRSFAAYWLATAAAGSFIFCALLALQGVASFVLSFRLFLRATSFLQLGAFFVVLGLFFLTPGATDLSITSPASEQWLRWFPSFWFLGLFQVMNGAVHPVFHSLASRALLALAIAFSVAALSYALAYFRSMRNIVELPDIAPAKSHRRWEWLLRKPLERAVILFAARTLMRSRQHRSIVAAYAGIGLAIALAYAKSLLYGSTNIHGSLRPYMSVPQWQQLNVPFMVAGFVILFFAILGVRAAFVLPSALKANWIFRITAIHSPRAYFHAVRKALYGLAAIPVLALAAAIYLTIWPRSSALAHLLVLVLSAIIIVERSLHEFRKVPFTCAYLPGQSDKRKVAIYGILFLSLTDACTRIEFWSLQSLSRYLVIIGILLFMTVRARMRWSAFASSPFQRLQFEEHAAPEIAALDLRREQSFVAEQYIDELAPKRPWPARVRIALLRTAIVVTAALMLGAAYEQFGQWRHKRLFPQIGRSVDIGGRSLNIFCSGEGRPAVIFESGAGWSGYTWVYVQRQVARHTRACWYDRAGYGWSDPAPHPRDSSAIARELHQLLHAAGVTPPYVLVGHSFGGLNVRLYNGIYPQEVAGLVLVDSTQPASESAGTAPPPSFGPLFRLLRSIGLLRLITDEAPGPPPKGVSEQEWRVATSFHPQTLVESTKELYSQSAQQAGTAQGLGSRPLIIMTAGLPPPADNPVHARQARARQSRWIEQQGELARLSTNAKQIVVQAGHCIHCDAPESVIEAIAEVVQQTRQH